MTRTKSPATGPLFVVALVLAFILVPQLASWYVDWLWFQSIELPQVFVTSFKAGKRRTWDSVNCWLASSGPSFSR